MAESRRSRTLVDSALTAGSLTTIATGGALIGLGLRDGEASRVFRLAGRGLLERFGMVSIEAPLTSVALGYVHHLCIATLWGALLGAVVLVPRSVTVRTMLALLLAAGYGLLSLLFVPPIVRIGYAVTANVADVVPIGVALVLALIGDIWLDATETRE